MRKRDAIVVLCAALALAALPAAGQSPEKPESSSQSPQPAASQGKPAPPPAAKPKGAEATLPADPEAAGKTVEEIIARVNKDRKSTRLNSSHITISYAVFCLKK